MATWPACSAVCAASFNAPACIGCCGGAYAACKKCYAHGSSLTNISIPTDDRADDRAEFFQEVAAGMNNITKNRFMEFFQESPQAQGLNLDVEFPKYDTNGDSVIDFSEFNCERQVVV